MKKKYTVSRNIASGNEEEYRNLKTLAERMGAIEIDDEIDLDCYDYPVGEYGKYYLNIEFATEYDRNNFVMATAKYYKK